MKNKIDWIHVISIVIFILTGVYTVTLSISNVSLDTIFGVFVGSILIILGLIGVSNDLFLLE